MGEIDGFQVLASFSDDEMEGFVTVISSSEPRQPIPDIDQLVQEIKRQGIVFGLDMERVWQALHDYNDGKPVQNYSVALGQPVEEGMDGRIEFKIDMSVQPKIVDSRVDYKEIDQFKSVEKGDLLAVKWKPRPGSRGTTVTGMAKSPRTGKTTLLFPGKNVVTQENTDAVYFYAGENGYVIVQSDRLSVFPVLTIKKDVDFSIGNIRFKGDVTIMGDVLPDFVVETTGKVTIYGTVLGSRIEAGGAVTIRGGVSGKDKGMVLSNEDIDISYVERGTIEGKKDVYVKTGVLNSTVLCYGKFYGDSPGGRIMESVIKAGQGIMAFNVGSPFTKRLDLICGMDVEKEKQLETANENLNNLVVELRQLKQKYGEENLKTQELAYFLRQYSGSKQVETDYHRYKELGALIQDCYNLVKQLQGEAFNVNAMVKVKGVVYPGTRIVIGEYELLVPKELHNVVFYKNTEEGAVKWTSEIRG